MKPRLALRVAAALLALALAAPASAESPDDVLVRGPEVVLTRADFDTELTRIPPEQRTAFVASPQRVQTMLNNLLVNRTLAVRAHAQGIDKDPAVARRLQLEAERALATVMVEQIESEAGAAFDRDADRNLTRARELYLVDRAKYLVPEEVEVSHILFDPAKRGKEAALAAATEARRKLVAGADFAAMALELSDDLSVRRNKGRLRGVGHGKVDPAFEAAAFALKNPGDISEPVLTRFGYHVIRLETRTPARQKTFDEVRGQIIADMRKKQIDEARDAAIGAIRSDSRLQVNQEAVEALVVHVEYPPLPDLSPKPAAPTPKKRK